MADYIYRCAAAAVLLLAAQLSPARAEEAFGIKGAVPGMKLSEFRAVPYPATRLQLKDKSARYELHCSNEDYPEGYSWPPSILVGRWLPAVANCFHIEISPPMSGGKITKYNNGNIWYAPIGFAGLRASWSDLSAIRSVIYRFSPENDADPRLMLIEVWFRAKKFQHLQNALTRKLGEPQTISYEQVQNRMGAKFQNEIVVWQTGPSTVALQKYTDTLDYGRLEVYHNELRASWLADVKRRRDSTPDDF